MRNHTWILFVAICAGFLTSCATKTAKVADATPVEMPVAKELYRKILPAIYEVVILKPDESRIVFDKPLADDQIPYQERNDKYRSIGTAFAMGENRFVSAAHVFPFALGSAMGKFFLRDQAGQVYEISSFTRFSNYRDLVEFQLAKPPAEVAVLQAADKIEIGETAINIGNALGQGISLRGGGQIASFTPEEVANQWKFIRFSSPASHGNSGGPLLNDKGEVLGVVTRGIPGEQLNFAVPIAELQKVSTTEAEFSIRDEKFDRGREIDRKTWSFHTALPASVSKLTSEASSALKKFTQDSWSALFKRDDARFFPANPKFQTYSRFQTVRNGIGLLAATSNGDWKTEYLNLHTTHYRPESDLKWYENRKSFYFQIERPKDISESDFLNDPRALFDSVAPIFELGENIYGTKRMIKSLGQPDSKKQINDDVGRPWIASEWNLPRLLRVDLFCSPTPTGAVCILFVIPPMSENLALEIPLQKTLDEMVWSYSGSVKDWQSFFKLKKEELPKFFEGATLAVAKDSIKLRMPQRSFSYSGDVAADDSEFNMKTGFKPDPKGSVEVVDISLKPDKSTPRFFFTEKYDEPSSENSKRAHEIWADIEGKKHHFDGAVHKHDRWSQVQIPLELVKEKPVHHWLTARCSRDEDESSDGLIEICQAFAKQNAH